jgi:predicted phosphodiesterase
VQRGKQVESEARITKPPPRPQEDFQTALDRMKTIQELREPLNIWKDEVDISVDTRGMPFFPVMPLADLHIGGEHTDYTVIEKYLRASRNYGIQQVHAGDMADMFSPKIIPEAMMDTVANPDEQLLTLRKFYEEYKDLIMVSATGNHDDWVRKASGVEAYRWLSQDLNVPLLNSGGVLNLNVNGIEYKGLLFHAIAKFNSSFNPTHAGKRALELHQDADFVISGHTHRFAMEKLVHRDKKPVVISLGSAKTEDMYGKRSYGMFPKVQVGFPIMFFDAHKKNIEVIEDLDTATYLMDTVKHYRKRRK